LKPEAVGIGARGLKKIQLTTATASDLDIMARITQVLRVGETCGMVDEKFI
jgi:hypothetical protein